MQEAIEM